jgi:hypothetical protein
LSNNFGMDPKVSSTPDKFFRGVDLKSYWHHPHSSETLLDKKIPGLGPLMVVISKSYFEDASFHISMS